MECEKTYSTKQNLHRHARNHHGVELGLSDSRHRFECRVDQCHMSFYHASALMEHYKSHDIEISKLSISLQLIVIIASFTKTLRPKISQIGKNLLTGSIVRRRVLIHVL